MPLPSQIPAHRGKGPFWLGIARNRVEGTFQLPGLKKEPWNLGKIRRFSGPNAPGFWGTLMGKNNAWVAKRIPLKSFLTPAPLPGKLELINPGEPRSLMPKEKSLGLGTQTLI